MFGALWGTAMMGMDDETRVRRPMRLPKLGWVVAAALAGVVVAEQCVEVGASVWCWGLAAGVMWFGFWSCRLALLSAVVMAFGLVHALERAGREAFPLAEGLSRGRLVEVRMVGLVESAPVVADGSGRCAVRVESMRSVEGAWRLEARVRVSWRSLPRGDAGLECGDRVVVTGWLAWPEPPRNPGEFDVAAWFRREGWVGEVRGGGVTRVEPAVAFGMKRWAWRLREALAEAITVGLDPGSVEAEMIETMVLGAQEGESSRLEETFLHAGTLHIFSVSGLHVGLVAVILWRVFNMLGMNRRQASWVSVPAVVVYALLTGWQPAAVRSAVMAGIVLVGIGLDRPSRFFNSLCLAAVLILAADTRQAFQAGAQLSFVVIGVIALAATPVGRRLGHLGEPDPFVPRELWSTGTRCGRTVWHWVSKSFGVSLVAAIGSAPLTVYHFQLVTPVSLLANMVHVPLAGLILATAGLSAAARPAGVEVASVFSNANWAFARACLLSGEWFSRVPGGSVWWNPRAARPAVGSCQVMVFDVGEGASVLIRTPGGRHWLIDTGRPGAFRSIVAPGLNWHGVRRLDGLIVSHGDHDHVGGAVDALARLRPVVVGHPRPVSRSPALRAVVREAAGAAVALESGSELELDAGFRVSVLWPPEAAALPLADDACLVLRLEVAGRSVLFSHDAGFLAERGMVMRHPDLRADVWIRGHHATDVSAQADFVARLRPSVIVNGRSGLRSTSARGGAETSALGAQGARVFDQRDCGAVRLEILPDGRWSVNSHLSP